METPVPEEQKRKIIMIVSANDNLDTPTIKEQGIGAFGH